MWYVFLIFFLLGKSRLSQPVHEPIVLASHKISLSDRSSNASVNTVFKENILLTISYLFKEQKEGKTVNWEAVNKPFHYDLVLQPHQMFAFHDDVLPQYKNENVITTNADFSSDQGYLSDGYLVGDGVCHLASLMNWVAEDAQEQVYAPTSHEFAVIPDISKKYGTAIYYAPRESSNSAKQNLYITNVHDYPVRFSFDYMNNTLTLSILKTS